MNPRPLSPSGGSTSSTPTEPVQGPNADGLTQSPESYDLFGAVGQTHSYFPEPATPEGPATPPLMAPRRQTNRPHYRSTYDPSWTRSNATSPTPAGRGRPDLPRLFTGSPSTARPPTLVEAAQEFHLAQPRRLAMARARFEAANEAEGYDVSDETHGGYDSPNSAVAPPAFAPPPPPLLPDATWDDKLLWFKATLAALRRTLIWQPATELNVDRATFELPQDLIGAEAGATWRRNFYVTFEGEDGVDSRGLTRDWLSQMLGRLFSSEAKLFVGSEADKSHLTFHPDLCGELTAQQTEQLRLAGRLAGKALHMGLPTGFPLNAHRINQLVGRAQTSLGALAEIEPDLANSWRSMLQGDVTDWNITFHVTDAKGRDVELIDDGAKVAVTNANKGDFVKAALQWALVDHFGPAMAAFKEGFADLVEQSALEAFSTDEARTLIAGQIDLDFEQWKSSAQEHRNVAPTTQHFGWDWFWSVLRELPPAQQKRLLWLSTGASLAPPGGFKDLQPRFTVSLMGSNEALPSAHTCFNKLDISNYASRDVLKTKLVQFIENCGDEFTIA